MSESAAVALDRESTRRRVSACQAETVRRLTEATVDEVAETGYEGLTVRGVARRAGVAPATAYTYFASKEHLLTEVFWRRLVALPRTDHSSAGTVPDRVRATLTDLALLVAGEPELAAACTVAMLGIDPDVKVLRDRIGAEWTARLVDALDDRRDPSVLHALQLALTGALVHAGLGHLSYDELPDRLGDTVSLLLRDEG